MSQSFLVGFLLLATAAVGIAQSLPLKPQQSGEKWGYADASGKFVIPAKYVRAEPFHEGYALVCVQRPFNLFGTGEMGIPLFAKCTYIDEGGHEIRKPFFIEVASNFSEGLAYVSPGPIAGGCAKLGYLDTQGHWAIKPRYDAAREFSEGLAAVSIGNSCLLGRKWGYIDQHGNVVVPFQFRNAGTFKKGSACARRVDGKWIAIKRTPNGAIVTEYPCASN